jgi:hypothetical protein
VNRCSYSLGNWGQAEPSNVASVDVPQDKPLATKPACNRSRHEAASFNYRELAVADQPAGNASLPISEFSIPEDYAPFGRF